MSDAQVTRESVEDAVAVARGVAEGVLPEHKAIQRLSRIPAVRKIVCSELTTIMRCLRLLQKQAVDDRKNRAYLKCLKDVALQVDSRYRIWSYIGGDAPEVHAHD